DREALYNYYGDRYYVYVHPYCRGLIYGEPTDHLIDKVIPEVLKLSARLTEQQKYTTASLTEPALGAIGGTPFTSSTML
ncbi:MAG: hypothetical protein ACP5QI_06000, partial [Candidatus Bathyarchaeia archaeon]